MQPEAHDIEIPETHLVRVRKEQSGDCDVADGLCSKDVDRTVERFDASLEAKEGRVRKLEHLRRYALVMADYLAYLVAAQFRVKAVYDLE